MTNYKISVCYSSIYLSSMTGKSQRERERERGDNGLFITLVLKVL